MSKFLEGKLTCLTSIYGEYGSGELSWAERAASLKNAQLVPVQTPANEWLESFATISWHMDAPGYSPAVYSVWKLMGAARRLGIKVMLEGQGADELLGGYPQYGALHLLSLLGDRTPRELWGEFRGLRRTFSTGHLVRWILRESFPRLFDMYRARVGTASLLRRDLKGTFGEAKLEYSPSNSANPSSRLISRLQHDFLNGILPGLLHYGDAMSMSRAVESRLPFMDYRLVQWMFRAPERMRIDDGWTKIALRNFLKRSGMSGIAERRDKRGYPTPAKYWLLGGENSVAKRLLETPETRIYDYCEPAAISKVMKQYQNGSPFVGDALYKLASLEMWLRVCLH